MLALNDHIWDMISAARACYGAVTGKVPIVTSANDGQHMQESLHYKDLALDFRTGHHWRKPLMSLAQVQELASRMRSYLGPDYDVVIEKDHLHVEYDPKGSPWVLQPKLPT